MLETGMPVELREEEEMLSPVMEKISREQRNAPEGLETVKVGNVVHVHVKIKEGDKERVQIYKGLVIARDGAGHTETFTVRRISHGVGVERVFPVHSPYVAKIELEREGRVRRAKLYYLKNLAGKKARLRQRRA
jgi:large subunit ribosomal protein L19